MKIDLAAAEAVIEKVRGSFIESAEQKFQNLDGMIDSLWDDRGQAAETMNQFLGEVHNLKGMGGTFGYPQITIVCHHLETYLEGVTSPSDGHLDGMQAYADSLRAGLQIWPTPDDDVIAGMIAALPKPEEAPATQPDAIEGETIGTALLISQNLSVRQLAEFFLDDFGFEVTISDSPLEAFATAIRTRPDIVVSAVEMEDLTGIGLISALKATDALKNTHFALLSASSDAGAISIGVPEGIAIINTTDMEEGIEQALQAFGL